MPSSDPLPRRQPSRRRRAGAPVESPPGMDWGAWLAGTAAQTETETQAQAQTQTQTRNVEAGPAFPVSPRPQTDPALDLRSPSPGGEAPDRPDPDLTRAEPPAAPLTRRARREREAAAGLDRPDSAELPSAGPVEPAPSPVYRAGRRDRSSGRRARWLLPTLAALLALVASSCLLDTSVSALVAAATFCPAVAIAAIPVIALAVRGRRWVTLAIAGLAAVLPWALAVGYAIPGPGQAETTGESLQVMTVNAQFGRADPTQIINAVRDHGVDVLVITELTNQLAHELTVGGLPAIRGTMRRPARNRCPSRRGSLRRSGQARTAWTG